MTIQVFKTFWKGLTAGLLAFGCFLSFAACGNTNQGEDMTDTNVALETEAGTEAQTEKPRLYDTVLTERIVERNGDRLAVNFCREDLVHFRFLPKGEEFLSWDAVPEAIAKPDTAYGEVYGECEEDETAFTLRTEGLTVKVDKSSLGITVLDPSGDPVFASAAQAFSKDGSGKTARFKRDVAGQEHYYGLGNDKGGDFTTTDHRNTEYSIWMSDDNVHAIIPLWYSSNGYGIYSNNSNRGTVSFKQDYHLHVEGGELNFYFLYGPEFKTILTNWSELAGRTAMPPLYALGLTYRGYSKWTDAQILEALRAQMENGIRIDVAGVEPGWQTATYPCSYAWAPAFTSSAKQFVDAAHELGLHVNLWEHPYVSPKADIYHAISELSLKGPDIGTRAWEGNNGTYAFGGLVPDLTIEEARDLYWDIQNRNLASIGVDGYKIDETDSWGANDSLTLLFPGGMSNNAYHNLLGTLAVNLMHERYREDYNLRTFIFSRGNYAGMQRYATTAYTDYYGFDQFVMSVIAQSYSGTYYTPEIRDVSTKSDVDYMRRAQLMFLTPFAMSNEYATESSVLDHSDAVIKCYKKYNDLHYALIPYMYSLFWEQHNTGVGVTRSLILEFQNDRKVYSVDNEFMLGDALLVCPVSDRSRVATVRIYLPAGEKWMDYNSGYIYDGGQTISYSCGADTLPLFVRMGSILPLGHYGRNTDDVTDPTLTLDIYPSQEKTSFTLYEDDGISFDYEKGRYALTELTSVLQNGQLSFTVGKRSGEYKLAFRDCVLQIHYRSAPSEITLDGGTVQAADSLEALYASSAPAWYYDGNADRDIDRILYVRFTDSGEAHTVTAGLGRESAQTLPGVVLSGSLYECEADGHTVSGFGKTDKAEASEKKVLGFSGSGSASLTMSGIKASADGTYDAEILYFNGGSDALVLNVSVNGSDSVPLYFYPTGGSSVGGTFPLTLSLKKGTNTLTLTAQSGKAPDLDAVIVYDGDPVHTEPKGTLYLAKDATLDGSLILEDNAGAYGGKTVSGFGKAGSCRMTYTVHRDAYGPYQLNIRYSSPSQTDRKLDLYINGEKSEIVLPGTMSPGLFRTASLTVYLNEGDNTIALGCEGGDVTYECEVGGEYKSCNTKLNDGGAHVHSGGYAVGASGNNGAFRFTMKDIEVPEDGTYTMQVYCGSGDRRTFRLKVNGEDVGDLYAVQTGHFHVFEPTAIEVYLEKGANTLTFWQDTTDHGDTLWVPNFDYVRIEGVKAEIDVNVALISIQ